MSDATSAIAARFGGKVGDFAVDVDFSAPMRGVIHGAASHTLRVEVTVMPLAAQSARTQGTAPAND